MSASIMENKIKILFHSIAEGYHIHKIRFPGIEKIMVHVFALRKLEKKNICLYLLLFKRLLYHRILQRDLQINNHYKGCHIVNISVQFDENWVLIQS